MQSVGEQRSALEPMRVNGGLVTVFFQGSVCRCCVALLQLVCSSQRCYTNNHFINRRSSEPWCRSGFRFGQTLLLKRKDSVTGRCGDIIFLKPIRELSSPTRTRLRAISPEKVNGEACEVLNKIPVQFLNVNPVNRPQSPQPMRGKNNISNLMTTCCWIVRNSE